MTKAKKRPARTSSMKAAARKVGHEEYVLRLYVAVIPPPAAGRARFMWVRISAPGSG